MTNQQRNMLIHMARISDEFDGYAPYGAGQWRTIRALDRMGLIVEIEPGECGDGCERAGDCPHPVSIFTLSEAGERMARELDQ